MVVETEYVMVDNTITYRTITTASQIRQAFLSEEKVIIHFPYNQAASSFIANEGYVTMVDYEPSYNDGFDEHDPVFGFIYPYSNLKDENQTGIFASDYLQPKVFIDVNDKICFIPMPEVYE